MAFPTTAAHEIIRLLTVDQRDSTGLVERAEKFRVNEQWNEIIELWKSEEDAEDSMLSYREELRGLAAMYLGVADWHVSNSGQVDGDTSQVVNKAPCMTAEDHFRKAEEAFSSLGNCYGVGLAYLARGFTHQFSDPDDKNGQARLWFRRSFYEFSQLASNYARTKDVIRFSRCNGLAGRVYDSIVLLEEKDKACNRVYLVPHVGEVAAGRPTLIATTASEFNVTEVIVTEQSYRLRPPWTDNTEPLQLLPNHSYFTLEVRGDSMIDAKLMPGDQLLVQHVEDVQQVVGKKDIAVVIIEDDAGPMGLVKQVKIEGDAVFLQSANPRYRTRKFRKDAVKVQGRVIGVMVSSDED